MSRTEIEDNESQSKPRDRRAFWRFCNYVNNGASVRAKKAGVPFNLDPYDIDKLLVDQKWRCAVTGVPLEVPGSEPGPFGPSLDRIVPSLGYVVGNVRVVCMIANFAMNQWGEAALQRLIAEAQR